MRSTRSVRVRQVIFAMAADGLRAWADGDNQALAETRAGIDLLLADEFAAAERDAVTDFRNSYPGEYAHRTLNSGR
jgi:hypothetical protein